MADLDACPHCGQAGFVRVKRWPWEKEGEPGLVWGYHVICDASGIDAHPRGCGASSGWGETQGEAIAAWNRRAAPQPAQVAVKPLEWKLAWLGEDGVYARTPFGRTYFAYSDGRWEDANTISHQAAPATMDAAKAAAQADFASCIAPVLAPSPADGAVEAHPDDAAVDRFAVAMKAKLKWEREECGRSGWQDMSAEALSRLLYEHLPKADPVDVANLAMMLHQNGQRITYSAALATFKGDTP